MLFIIRLLSLALLCMIQVAVHSTFGWWGIALYWLMTVMIWIGSIMRAYLLTQEIEA